MKKKTHLYFIWGDQGRLPPKKTAFHLAKKIDMISVGGMKEGFRKKKLFESK